MNNQNTPFQHANMEVWTSTCVDNCGAHIQYPSIVFSVTPSTNKQGKCFSNTKHIERTPIWKYKSHPASTIVARTFNTLLYFSITSSTNKKENVFPTQNISSKLNLRPQLWRMHFLFGANNGPMVLKAVHVLSRHIQNATVAVLAAPRAKQGKAVQQCNTSPASCFQ